MTTLQAKLRQASQVCFNGLSRTRWNYYGMFQDGTFSIMAMTPTHKVRNAVHRASETPRSTTSDSSSSNSSSQGTNTRKQEVTWTLHRAGYDWNHGGTYRIGKAIASTNRSANDAAEMAPDYGDYGNGFAIKEHNWTEGTEVVVARLSVVRPTYKPA